mmetsp:Transcript_28627/g.56071  ORF Transcript_28627/g.56071 Transcript_28627/m.56071 type:complete len:132 (-) Transcript_28627:74-469(-)
MVAEPGSGSRLRTAAATVAIPSPSYPALHTASPPTENSSAESPRSSFLFVFTKEKKRSPTTRHPDRSTVSPVSPFPFPTLTQSLEQHYPKELLSRFPTVSVRRTFLRPSTNLHAREKHQPGKKGDFRGPTD